MKKNRSFRKLKKKDKFKSYNFPVQINSFYFIIQRNLLFTVLYLVNIEATFLSFGSSGSKFSRSKEFLDFKSASAARFSFRLVFSVWKWKFQKYSFSRIKIHISSVKNPSLFFFSNEKIACGKENSEKAFRGKFTQSKKNYYFYRNFKKVEKFNILKNLP